MSQLNNEKISSKKQKLETKNDESIDLKLIKQRIEDKLNTIEFNLFNTDYQLKEYCNEIKRQIQLD